VVSSTNTFTGLVPGVSVVATNVASAPVTITVAQDTSSVATAMQNFVSSYNSIVTYISSNSQYSSTANTLGLLFADPTANTISTQLANFVNSKFGASTDSVRSLGQLGVTLGTDGTLTLNTSQLQSLLQSDPTSVIDFLTNSTNGLAARFQKVTNTLTTAGTGVISTRSHVLSSTILRQTNNIATLNTQLKAQQTMLFNQFYAMETALSSLKTQQSALSALTGFSTSSSSSGTTTG
jgi:flagellar hook-associated protein 2